MQERYRERNRLLFVNSSADKPLIPAINRSSFLMSGGGVEEAGETWKKLTQACNFQVERAWN